MKQEPVPSTTTGWMPPPCGDETEGCVWLPRMLAKARRLVASERAGRDLLSPYLFGDTDPFDGALMRFLRTNENGVLDLLRREPDDAAAAAQLVRRSGRTPEECVAWSTQFRRRMRLLIACLEADEGRWTGRRAAAARFFYNHVVMPPVYWLHRNDPQRRIGRGEGVPSPGAYPAGMGA